MGKFAKSILRHSGWTIIDSCELPLKCVICIAPHTSNWDFVIGYLYKMSVNIKAIFFMKKEMFWFPLGVLLKAMGGIPINRSKKTSITNAIAEQFSLYDELRVGITPEGTRSYNANWKLGFYYIALKAQVPIVLASLDYAKKEVGVGQIIMPTGDVEADMVIIKNYFRDKKGKIPEKFGL